MDGRMNIEQKIIVALSILILLGASLAGYEMVKAHITEVVATVQQRANDVAKAVDDKNIAMRDARQAEYTKAISAQQARVRTSAQAVTIIDHYVPPATPQAGPVVIAKADMPAAIEAKLPDAPSYVVTTQDQSIGIGKKLLQGDADASALATCQLDLTDTRDKVIRSEQDAATWERAAKGGSKWTRIKSAGKYLVIGAATGAAAAYVVTHR